MGNSPVSGEFPAQRPVTRNFDIFFDLRLNKRLSKQSWGWWFGTLSRPSWRQCNESMSQWWMVEYTSKHTTCCYATPLYLRTVTQICLKSWDALMFSRCFDINSKQKIPRKCLEVIKSVESISVENQAHMMTSSNGNIFSVTGLLCGEFTKKGRTKRLSKQSGRRWFETPSRPLWRQCNEHTNTLLVGGNNEQWGLNEMHGCHFVDNISKCRS